MTNRLFVPRRGEVWYADFGFVELDELGAKRYTRFHEQADRRPCVILSHDAFNAGSTELVVVVPVTTAFKNSATHVAIDPPEGGLRQRSYVMCEGVRSFARQFLIRKVGRVDEPTIRAITDQVATLLVI